jgi:hypothetical protein
MEHICKYGNESSRSIKYEEFLEEMRDCHLLNNDSALWN